ncbi:MAG: hypothetical protein LBV61_01120, partial [Burkholderiaceae bacterium]|nr:hypothetical protein [Burkholderiaceae bacterium]
MATGSAINYIYVENQYFQLPDWSILVKQKRQSNRQKMIEAGTRVDDIVPLHLFIVIPQPERNGMVPNTYDTLQQLDQGQGLGRYDAQVQGRIRDETQGPLKRPVYKPYGTPAQWAQYQQDMTVYEKQKAEREARAGAVVGGSARRAPANPRAELQQLGIKVLVAT